VIRSKFNYDNAEFKFPFLYENTQAETEPVKIPFLVTQSTNVPDYVQYLFPTHNDQHFNMVIYNYMASRFFELFVSPILLHSRLREFHGLADLDLLPLWKIDEYKLHMLSNRVRKDVHVEFDTSTAISTQLEKVMRYIYTYPERMDGWYGTLGSMDYLSLGHFNSTDLSKYVLTYATAMVLQTTDTPIGSTIKLKRSYPLRDYDHYALNGIGGYSLNLYDDIVLETFDGYDMQSFMFESCLDQMTLDEFNYYLEYFRTYDVHTYQDYSIGDLDGMIMSDYILT